MNTSLITTLTTNNSIQSSIAMQQAQKYSECVSLIYPKEEINIPGKALVGSFLLALFIGVLIGLRAYYKKPSRNQTEWFETFFVVPLLCVLAWVGFWLIASCVLYLLS